MQEPGDYYDPGAYFGNSSGNPNTNNQPRFVNTPQPYPPTHFDLSFPYQIPASIPFFQPPPSLPHLPPNPIPIPIPPVIPPPPVQQQHQQEPSERLKIKIPHPTMRSVEPSGYSLRRSARRKSTPVDDHASGSEYDASPHSSDQDAEGEDDDLPAVDPPLKVEYTKTSHGRKTKKISYAESDEFGDENLGVEDEDDDAPIRRPTRRTRSRNLAGFVEDEDDEDDDNDENDGRGPSARLRSRDRKRSKRLQRHQAPTTNGSASKKPLKRGPSDRAKRAARRNRQAVEEDAAYEEDHISSHASDDHMDAQPSTDHEHLNLDADADAEADDADAEAEADNDNNRPYSLRQRQRINYAVPTLEDIPKAPPKKPKPIKKRQGPGWSAGGAELGRWMGLGDDSDSDHLSKSPRKPYNPAAGGAFAGGVLPGDFAPSGGPSNFGKVGDAALADVDPLGVNVNVTFDEVGGLDEHIHSLKEMTLLPLLYPEVFQKFNVTPPRGVLFHGPPGTGKTLLARALAASSRSGGRKISFFMRKGADCLSKWVGEAERQLRLLFEEAKASQPSIIFFDEIDGLAPVRSSKQDQIHASIVSTLLALMDGMDGRGQVVIIGATNRPDAVDPALRRPGRFDREFYFGLPSLEAREKILGIMTKGWKGWGKDEQGVTDNVKGLAKLTKGYGGADLRALCTEAALNAIQRRYPQIYKSQDRLLLSPDTIEVELRDFMISVKKIVPSSARSSSSIANPLPTQLVPLLSSTLEQAKAVVSKTMPVEKHRTALEEAEYEDAAVGGEKGLAREMLVQSMETLRIYRPRVAICGDPGMGQTYIGAAVLHHLEGYHVQSLELGSLMSDSTRSIETAIVQLFVEAKRHRPAVVYIPSLVGWCAAVSETARSTVRAMLDTLLPTDPVLLLAIVDGEFRDLPRDVRAWFGPTSKNRVQMMRPDSEERETFFADLIKDIRRPPNEFPDGVPRRKRVLEVLPVAPPLEPRKPTQAELEIQEQSDNRTLTLLKYRLGPILTELRRKFKRFTKRATEEYHFEPGAAEPEPEPEPEPHAAPPPPPDSAVIVIDGPEDEATLAPQPMAVGPEPAGIPPTGENSEIVIPNGVEVPESIPIIIDQQPDAPILPDAIMEPISIDSAPPPPPTDAPPRRPRRPELYDIDLERMQVELFEGKYLIPEDFLDDIGRMVHNARMRQEEDMDRFTRAQQMFIATQVSINDFDPQFRLECERMAVRERQRRKEREEEWKAKEKAKAESAAAAAAANAEPAVRRSARNDGRPPEFNAQDPTALERRLKRHRSTEGGADSHTQSEEERSGQKRLRTTPPQEDELNIRSFRSASKLRSGISTPLGHEVRPPSHRMDVDDALPATSGTPQPLPQPQPISHFPHTLLNGTHTPTPSTPRSGLMSLLNPVNKDPVASTRHTPDTQSASQEPPPTTTTEHPSPAMEIIIERTPTPPHPDFYLDEYLLEQLKLDLRDKTSILNVEQLEQLRATCLGCVWQRRQEWDRTELIKEISSVRHEFVTEVELDMAENRVGTP